MPSSGPTFPSPNDASSRRGLLRATGAALSASLAGCVGGDPSSQTTDETTLSCSEPGQPFPNGWPLYGYDSRNTGVNPNAVGPKEEAVEVDWSVNERGALWGAPVVADDAVYLQERPTRLSAFAREDGSKRWSAYLGATGDSGGTRSHSGPHSTPAVVGDTVYVGGGNFEVEKDGPEVERVANHVRLYAIDRRTGDVRWTVQPDEFVGTAPIVVGDAVVFATLDGTVYGVERESGSVAWTLSVETLEAPLATPAADGCELYLNSVEGGLYAIDARRGELDWHLPAVGSGAPPAVSDGLVYVGGRDGTLYAIDSEQETVKWEFDAGRAISTASPAVSSGTVFVGNADGDSGEVRARVHALDAATGEELWSAETAEYVNSSPAVADGAVYVAALDSVYGFDAETGEELWKYDVNAAIRAPLSVADDTVYVGKLNGQLHALTGQQT